ncbi:SDR family NAD(P)-dependent oxidoreductase [Amycolatopsis sp. NPDC051102]|uniref:SDR family NAD(P)-dependent oxidoreductase n=1 Tax=Amycolatopsis sp. NPDC051102 TaxID=3155163 RepID=UPI0034419ED3
MERPRERRLLVTGAASGIGRATTQRQLTEGARVVATDVADEASVASGVAIAPGSAKSGITDSAASWLPQEVDFGWFGRLLPILPTGMTTEVGNPVTVPESVAGVVAMLVSEDGEFITGTEIRIDGGTHA